MPITNKAVDLLQIDPKTLSAEDLSKYNLAIYRKRKAYENAMNKFKKLETEAKRVAMNSEFMAGVQESDLLFGSYKRAEKEYMQLPEGGWPVVFQHIADRIKAGEDPSNVLGILSHQRLNTKFFEKINDDELPVGIGRVKDKYVNFTPKRNVEI